MRILRALQRGDINATSTRERAVARGSAFECLRVSAATRTQKHPKPYGRSRFLRATPMRPGKGQVSVELSISFFAVMDLAHPRRSSPSRTNEAALSAFTARKAEAGVSGRNLAVEGAEGGVRDCSAERPKPFGWKANPTT